jgi:hypothetical protein
LISMNISCCSSASQGLERVSSHHHLITRPDDLTRHDQQKFS